MRVLKKEPGKEFVVTEINNELSALQEAVGGYIEVFPVSEEVLIICNEEGKLNGLPFNVKLCNEIFVGTILIVGQDGEEFADVPEDLIKGLQEVEK